MLRACAWCNKQLPSEGDDHRVTHTICRGCVDNLDFQLGVALQTYLDSLPMPIVVVDADVRVRMANATACSLLDTPRDAMIDQLGGTVFECAYARLPAGCGKTIHCSGCAIRRAVTDTYLTGQGHFRAAATLMPHAEAPGPIALRLTTQLLGECVLLRIDSLGDTEFIGDPDMRSTP